MEKRASIDIGSNTILLLAAEVNESPFSYKEILNETFVTSLGKDLDKTGVFCENSLKDSFEALSDYKEKVESIGITPSEVIVTATEASRVAKNSKEFFDKVKAELGFNVQIISALGEAYYTSLGVIKGHKLDSKTAVIMDVGGASTELILIERDPFEIIRTISLPVGSVRGTDWIEDGSFETRMKNLLDNEELDNFKSDYLLCVAGSMTSLGGMIKGLKKFDSNEVNGSAIGFDKYLKFFESIEGLKPEELLEKFPFLGKRAKSILAGARLGLKMGKRLEIRSFEISTFGLRYGTLFSGKIESKYGEL
ncbi:MAG: exopolyphosphatase/guanosine-5'-triphosphate,3'-diphosphate pyrophosphatase [Bacteriovoracaceae bacterium]